LNSEQPVKKDLSKSQDQCSGGNGRKLDDHSSDQGINLKKEPYEESKLSCEEIRTLSSQDIIDLVSSDDESDDDMHNDAPANKSNSDASPKTKDGTIAFKTPLNGKKMLLSQSNSAVKAKVGIADYFSGAVVDLSMDGKDDEDEEDDVVELSSSNKKAAKAAFAKVSESTKEAQLMEKKRRREISAFKHFIDDTEEGI
jgi:hypothetical protein